MKTSFRIFLCILLSICFSYGNSLAVDNRALLSLGDGLDLYIPGMDGPTISTLQIGQMYTFQIVPDERSPNTNVKVVSWTADPVSSVEIRDKANGIMKITDVGPLTFAVVCNVNGAALTKSFVLDTERITGLQIVAPQDPVVAGQISEIEIAPTLSKSNRFLPDVHADYLSTDANALEISSDQITWSSSCSTSTRQPLYFRFKRDGSAAIRVKAGGITQIQSLTGVEPQVWYTASSGTQNQPLHIRAWMTSKKNIRIKTLGVSFTKLPDGVTISNMSGPDANGETSADLTSMNPGVLAFSAIPEGSTIEFPVKALVNPLIGTVVFDNSPKTVVYGDSLSIPLDFRDMFNKSITVSLERIPDAPTVRNYSEDNHKADEATIPASANAVCSFSGSDLLQKSLSILGTNPGRCQVSFVFPNSNGQNLSSTFEVTVVPQVEYSLTDPEDGVSVADLFGDQIAKEFFVRKFIVTNHLDQAHRPDLQNKAIAIDANSIYATVNTDQTDPNTAKPLQLKGYRPFSADTLNLTSASRKNRDPITKLWSLLGFAGTAFTFMNSSLASAHSNPFRSTNSITIWNSLNTTVGDPLKTRLEAIRDAKGSALATKALEATLTVQPGTTQARYLFFPRKRVESDGRAIRVVSVDGNSLQVPYSTLSATQNASPTKN